MSSCRRICRLRQVAPRAGGPDMATPYPGQPTARKRVDAADVARLTARECRMADEAVAFLLRHGLSRKEAATVLHLAISKNELFQSKSPECQNSNA